MPNAVFVPGIQRTVVFQDRTQMYRGKILPRYRLSASLPTPKLPVDWAKNMQFPIYGNDRYGDCMYAAAVHGDQTLTGNATTQSRWNTQDIVNAYLHAAGGDRGMDEGMIVSEWKKGLAGNPDAKILDALDIDPTNPAMMQSAMYLFGCVQFMLSVPSKWINNFDPKGSYKWDAPAIPNPFNGHGVLLNGVNANGEYHVETWGGWCWLTPAGVTCCQPSAFTVFSLRWFNPQTGLAPNGMSYDQLAALWVQAGGATLPPSPFAPTPAPPPTPTPPPPPSPSPARGVLVIDLDTHTIQAPDGWSIVPNRSV